MSDPKNNKPSEELVLVEELANFEIVELDEADLDKVAGGNGNCGGNCSCGKTAAQ